MPSGYKEFEFDLPQALLTSLIQIFDSMDGDLLTPSNVAAIPEQQGVYQLFHKGQLAYIGKTDGQAGLKQRLNRHAWTIQHRNNLEVSEVTFKAIRVYVFTAMDLETQLIEHYRKSAPVAWNFSGFGSNDPGRQRDTTTIKREGFDAQFPVDLDRLVTLDSVSGGTASDVLGQLRKSLPYTLRFEGGRVGHADLDAALVTLPNAPFTARELLTRVIESLPAGWQLTLLPGRVILYKENREYASGEVIARSK